MTTLRRLLIRSAPAALAFLAASCASYTQRTESALRAFQGGQLDAALAGFGDGEELDSEFLAGAESGTVALTAGDWDRALVEFHRAADAARDIEGRALAGAEELGEGLMSWVTSDRALSYQGEGFERVYVHVGLAMAYLARGQLDAVYVEARRANQLLETEEELYDKRYRAGGWGHLMSALAYELLGEADQAYVDYVRMHEKDVGSALAGPALVRLATRLGREDELERWTADHGPGVPPADHASVVVLAGVGLGPTKVEGRLVVQTFDGAFTMAGTSYRVRPQRVTRLRVRVGDDTADTTVVESVTDVAVQNHEDRQLWSLSKSAARGLLKRELTQKLEKEHGFAGRVAGDLFAILSERADLRHWRTLPDTWQAARLFVPAGIHPLALEAVGAERIDLGSYELEPGETMLVFARSVGARLHAHAIGGRPVRSEP